MKTRPLVSIVIPCYNSSKFVAETIDSVLNQSYKNIELIVVNDGSTDNSLSIIQQFTDNRIQLISKENAGVSAARNSGFKKAKGEFIMFLDADDLIDSSFVEKAVITFQQNTKVDFITTNIINIDENSELLEKKQVNRGTYQDVQKEIVSFSMFVHSCPSAYIYRKNKLEKHKIEFNTELQSAADRYFLLQVGRYLCGSILAGDLMKYRKHAQSMSQLKNKKLVIEQKTYYDLVLRNNVLCNNDVLHIFKKKMNYQLMVDFIKLVNIKYSVTYGIRYIKSLLSA